MKEQTKLKPCPFCGSQPKVKYKVRNRDYGEDDTVIQIDWTIYCEKCRVPSTGSYSEYKIDPYTEELQLAKRYNNGEPKYDGYTKCVDAWNMREQSV